MLDFGRADTVRECAKGRRTVYFLTTNLVGDLDDAAIREGRFDASVGVFPPDLLSRTGRLVSQLVRARSKLDKGRRNRLAVVVQQTRDAPMTPLCKPGWFTAPSGKAADGTPFQFILKGQNSGIPEGGLEPEGRRPNRPNLESKAAVMEWREWGLIKDWDEGPKNGVTWVTLLRRLANRPALPKDPR